MKTLTLGLMAGLTMAACAPMQGDLDMPGRPNEQAQQCKADQYRGWIGRNRSELPAQPTDETWRVTCTTCPVTMDFNPNRLNILFNQSSGVIEQVKCG